MPDNKELSKTEKEKSVSGRTGKRAGKDADIVPVCKKK